MEPASSLITVSLGEVKAQCPRCGSRWFATPEPGEELTLLSELVCALCEAPTTQAELIVQISQEALRTARARLQAETRRLEVAA
jgi:hypothetical protein